MGVVIIEGKPTEEDISRALEDHGEFDYIKITVDIENNAIALGGEYHADAEKILIEKFNSKNSKIWGGGYNTKTKVIRTDALLNHKPNLNNPSSEILDQEAREKFLELAKSVAQDIDSLI